MADKAADASGGLDDEPGFTRLEKVIAFLVGGLIVVTLATVLLYGTVAVRILPGEVGVRYSLLFGGTVLDREIPPGFALKLPWDLVYRYEVRTQRTSFVLDALSQDDMQLQISAAVLFRPKPGQVPYLHEAIGPEYVDRVVAPVATAGVREAAAGQVAFTLYSESFGDFKNQAMMQLRAHPVSQYIDFEDIAITKVKLPEKLTEAIEDKLSQEQLYESFQYRLRTQIQEAERRRIEAIGIRVFYNIVRGALTPDLLQWRGIEATVQLARSFNSKVIVIGSGKDQLPIILGSDLTRSETRVVEQGAMPAEGQDTFDTDPDSFQVDPDSFEQLPDFGSLPSIFDDSILLPRTERAPSSSPTVNQGPADQTPANTNVQN